MQKKYYSLIAVVLTAIIGFCLKGNVGDDPAEAEEAALSNGSTEELVLESDADEDFQSADGELSVHYSSLEIPTQGPDHHMRIEHTGYTLSYDTLNHTPFWVAWELTSEETRGRVARAEEFLEDPSVPAHHAVRPSTYSGSGYSRGHMCPAGDQKWSHEAMNESFYMTNMCPQTFQLNNYWWDWLERAERQWAQEEGRVYIVCGPIYDSNRKVDNLGRKNFFVGVPHRFFKVILSTRPGHEKALAFIYRNDDSEQLLPDALTSVDQVERITGFDFFAPLEDKLETRIEAHSDLSAWGNVPQPEWDY